jgi:hypothetical protein
MRFRAKSLIAMVAILVSTAMPAQEIQRPGSPAYFAKLSYDTSAPAQERDARRICMAVSADGSYRILRLLDRGETERLQGKMPQQQFDQLKALLDASAFKSLSGNHGGLIRQESESFGAEIPFPAREPAGPDVEFVLPRARRVQWLNADGESPFPQPIAKVVDWMKHFQPKDAQSFEYDEYPDVCPRVGLRLIQPAIAANQGRTNQGQTN